jgi:hypothetical protein
MLTVQIRGQPSNFQKEFSVENLVVILLRIRLVNSKVDEEIAQGVLNGCMPVRKFDFICSWNVIGVVIEANNGVQGVI